jgi:hypothetical protein
MWVCWRAADSIQANVRPYYERDAALREAGARLAYVTTGIRAVVLAKSQSDNPGSPFPARSLVNPCRTARFGCPTDGWASSYLQWLTDQQSMSSGPSLSG